MKSFSGFKQNDPPKQKRKKPAQSHSQYYQSKISHEMKMADFISRKSEGRGRLSDENQAKVDKHKAEAKRLMEERSDAKRKLRGSKPRNRYSD